MSINVHTEVIRSRYIPANIMLQSCCSSHCFEQDWYRSPAQLLVYADVVVLRPAHVCAVGLISVGNWGLVAGPGAYTPQQPQASHKKHRVPEIVNPTAVSAIAALQAKLRSSRHAAFLEASAVEEVVKATLKHGTVEVNETCCAVHNNGYPMLSIEAVLCCAVLCCAVLCCAVLCCAVLCCAVLCCAVLNL